MIKNNNSNVINTHYWRTTTQPILWHAIFNPPSLYAPVNIGAVQRPIV